MNGRYLLDTNIVIALFAQDVVVIEKLQETEDIFIPSIVIGELYYGAQKSGQIDANTRRVDEFAVANVILSCDHETARWYGQVKNKLRAKGQPIPENDVWIAALAIQHNLILVTRDEHFKVVTDLQIEKW